MKKSVIARSEATTRLRLLRKLRRAGSPPKLGERKRKQSIAPQAETWIASLAMTILQDIAGLSGTDIRFGPQRVNSTLALASAPSITIEIAAST